VSHRIDEVLAIADRVSVLRDGRVVDAWVGKEVTSGEVIASMLGTNMQERIEHVAAAEEVQQPNTLRRRATERGQPVLRVRNVRDNSRLRGVSFDVHGGEILGIVGLPGNGQDELVNSLAGLAKPVAGTITLQGRTLQTGSPRRMIRAGVGIVPGDRKSQGLVLGLSVLENLLLASSARRPFATSGIVRRRASRSAAEKLIADLQIKTAGQDVPAGVLSGGNQQKIVIGKWILRGCKLLILDQPTRGIDTGAKDEIYKLLRAIADNGTAILMITYEIEEATVADRVLVIRSGAIGKELASVELAHSLDGHQAVYGS
jgi:ribose transport system ATP-binding protein